MVKIIETGSEMAVTRGSGEGMGNCNSRGAKLQLCKTGKSQRPSGLHCACSQECSTMHGDICQKARSHVICSYHNLKKKHINKYTISLIKGKEPHKDMDETQVNYVLSEGSRTQKPACCLVLFIQHSGEGKPVRTEHSSLAARGWW